MKIDGVFVPHFVLTVGSCLGKGHGSSLVLDDGGGGGGVCFGALCGRLVS